MAEKTGKPGKGDNGEFKVTFAKMKMEHLPQVLEIEERSFPSPWSYRAFACEILENPIASYIVALAGEKVVGYAGMWVILDEAHITNVAVHPNWRKRGLGRALMQEIMRRAARRGAARITLEVRPSNAAARRLYAALGFTEAGLRKNYYIDNNEDAIIMWKEVWLKHGKGVSL